jgi:hypothetical protein
LHIGGASLQQKLAVLRQHYDGDDQDESDRVIPVFADIIHVLAPREMELASSRAAVKPRFLTIPMRLQLKRCDFRPSAATGALVSLGHGHRPVIREREDRAMTITILDPNYQGPFGNTLLHSAVVSGDLDEVQRLLAAGANPRIANRDGKTPLHAASILGYARIEELLRGDIGRGKSAVD